MHRPKFNVVWNEKSEISEHYQKRIETKFIALEEAKKNTHQQTIIRSHTRTMKMINDIHTQNTLAPSMATMHNGESITQPPPVLQTV